MSLKEVAESDIAAILNYRVGYPPPPQEGPLRYSDIEKTCVTKGCTTNTYIRVNRIPYCTMCALHELNKLFITKGLQVIQIVPEECAHEEVRGHLIFKGNSGKIFPGARSDMDPECFVCVACNLLMVIGGDRLAS